MKRFIALPLSIARKHIIILDLLNEVLNMRASRMTLTYVLKWNWQIVKEETQLPVPRLWLTQLQRSIHVVTCAETVAVCIQLNHHSHISLSTLDCIKIFYYYFNKIMLALGYQIKHRSYLVRTTRLSGTPKSNGFNISILCSFQSICRFLGSTIGTLLGNSEGYHI